MPVTDEQKIRWKKSLINDKETERLLLMKTLWQQKRGFLPRSDVSVDTLRPQFPLFEFDEATQEEVPTKVFCIFFDNTGAEQSLCDSCGIPFTSGFNQISVQFECLCIILITVLYYACYRGSSYASIRSRMTFLW